MRLAHRTAATQRRSRAARARARARRAGAALAVAGALGAAQAALGQDTFELAAATDRQRQVVEEIRGITTEDGPFASALISPLTQLGLIYREDGDRVLARGAIEQARQVVRVNYGLHSLEETPLIRQAIENDEALGQFSTAWQLEQQLLGSVARHPDDERIVPILTEIGDKRTDVLKRYLAGEFPPQIILGCYYREPRPEWLADAPIGKCTSGSRDRVVQALSLEARSYYLEAIQTLVRHERYSDPALAELEKRVIRNSFSTSAYLTGRESYRRLLSYQAANEDPWLARITTAIELADWQLQFAQHAGTIVLDSVLRFYGETRKFLDQAGADRATIDALFAPSIPVMLPSFLPNPLVSQRTPHTTGYVDVAFRITKYGRSRGVRVLDTTTNAPKAARDKLVHLIAAGIFRPRLADGRPTDDAPVVLRYYLND